jgi:hypothetical protein
LEIVALPVRKHPNAPINGAQKGSKEVSKFFAIKAIKDENPLEFWPEFIISWTAIEIEAITKNGSMETLTAFFIA